MAAIEKSRPISRNRTFTVRGFISLSPQICLPCQLPRCKARRRLALVQEPEAPPSTLLPSPLPQGLDCVRGPECTRLSPCAAPAGLPNESALGVALCGRFRPHCPGQGSISQPLGCLIPLRSRWDNGKLSRVPTLFCVPYFQQWAQPTFVRIQK